MAGLIGHAAAYGGFLLLVAASVPFLEAATRYSHADRFIGDIAYPIYIGHLTLLMALWALGLPKGAVSVLVAWPLMVLVAIPLVKYIEQPMARLRRVDLGIGAKGPANAPARDAIPP